MRQGQNNNNNNNNKRTRGRGRKPQSSANRTYDSNGPDVKIRGSAAHVAEKYVTLARDAQVSGDRIASENYLQHAEHYFRIIAAAQAQNPIQNVSQGSGSNPSQAASQSVAQQAPGTGEQPATVNGQGRGHGASRNRDAASDAPTGRRNEQTAPKNDAEAAGESKPKAVSAIAEATDGDSGEREVVEPSRPVRKPRTRRPRAKVAVAEGEKAESEGTESSEPVTVPSKVSAPEAGDEDLQPETGENPIIAEAG